MDPAHPVDLMVTSADSFDALKNARELLAGSPGLGHGNLSNMLVEQTFETGMIFAGLTADLAAKCL